MNIGKKDLVLEIGPGAYPHWRSDCLVDKYDPSDEVNLKEFGGKPMELHGKPLFKTNDGKLPFKDKAFDYIICSHVLEHVPEMELPVLVNEINRVAEKKYIEFPTLLYDFFYDFEVHCNFLDIIDDTIYCLPKQYSSLSSVKAYTSFALMVRQSQNLGIENVNPAMFAVGKEFEGNVNLEILHSENDFFELLNRKYQSNLNNILPSTTYRISDKLNKTLRKLSKERTKEFFNGFLK